MMAFLDNQNPPIVSNNVAALRTVSTSGLDANSRAFVEVTSRPTAIMRWNPQDGATDNEEAGIIRPNDVDPSAPGRWRFEAWV